MRSNAVSTINQQVDFLSPSHVFPATRFQGSKLKIAEWIWETIQDIHFNTALDAFGGTGSISYMLKTKGKEVTYNDILKFNWYIGLALIENDSEHLADHEINAILTRNPNINYPTFIQETFHDIYFTDEENEWIDIVVTNIQTLESEYKKALAYFALFQSCIIKRPFNLFHRKNLYIRFSNVERNFGNKATWDKPFDFLFRKFVAEANRAVFSNSKKNESFNLDVFNIDGQYDLIYIDTPYISNKGIGTDYLGFYHFLEGLVNYNNWAQMMDKKTKHKRLKGNPTIWTDKKIIASGFDRLFDKFKDSVIVVSYRSDGIPTVEELFQLLKKYKHDVREVERKNYKYVLSTNHTEEILLIGS